MNPPRLPDLSRIVTQVAAKGRCRRGRNTGVPMSGHLRFCFAAFVLIAGLSTSPASSNTLTDWFNVAPRQARRPLPRKRKRSACRGPASRRRMASTGSTGWTATASAGSRPLRRPRGRSRFVIASRSLVSPLPRRTRPRGASERRSRMRVRSCRAPHRRKRLSRRGLRPSSRWLMPLPSWLRRSRPSCRRQPSKTSRAISPRPTADAAPGRRGEASGGRAGHQRPGCRLRASVRRSLFHRRGGR